MQEGGESSEPGGAEEGLSDPLRWQDPGEPGHSIAQGGSEVMLCGQCHGGMPASHKESSAQHCARRQGCVLRQNRHFPVFMELRAGVSVVDQIAQINSLSQTV